MMTATARAIGDSSTMVRRSLRHMRRYPSLTFFVAAVPVVLLLLFVFVFGGTLGTGLGGATGGRDAYVAYVVPGILVLTVVGAAQGTTISVAMDMAEGIVARFRTMSISRTSVLTGHVVGAVIQTVLAMALVLAVALLVGFRPATGPVDWLAAAGLLVLVSVGVSWVSIAMGLSTKSVETASNLPMLLMLLLFLGSAFVPTASLPEPLRWFAENQPFTPMIETLRGLLLGTPIGDRGIIAVAWCVAMTVLGFLAARRLYERDTTRG